LRLEEVAGPSKGDTIGLGAFDVDGDGEMAGLMGRKRSGERDNGGELEGAAAAEGNGAEIDGIGDSAGEVAGSGSTTVCI
jgi:hypothetical protein